MKHRFRALWAVVALAGGAVATAETPSLGIGSKAPAIQVSQWYKGSPVSSFEPGGIYVVEFWATWCGPCKQAIPHITQLAHTYKGKVSFTGISVAEEGKDIPARIRAFVAQMGGKMDYNVAGDTPDNRMLKTWLKASGENSLPKTFVVDGTGRIAWIGGPHQVEEPLKQMIAGTYDLDAESRKWAEEAAASEAFGKLDEGLRTALNAKDFDAAVALIRKAFADKAPNKGLLVMNGGPGLLRIDEARARAEFRTLLASRDHEEVAGALMALVDTDGLSPQSYEMFLDCIREKLEEKPENSFLWHMLAKGCFQTGNPGKAREAEEKALAMLKKDPEADPEDRQDYEAALAKYKKAKAGVRKTPAPLRRR